MNNGFFGILFFVTVAGQAGVPAPGDDLAIRFGLIMTGIAGSGLERRVLFDILDLMFIVRPVRRMAGSAISLHGYSVMLFFQVIP